MKKINKKLFMSIHGELGLSHPTALKYCREHKFPEAIALNAERLTDGELSASIMCPNTLGAALPSHKKLASQCLAMFDHDTPSGPSATFLAAVLTFLEEQQPSLHQELMFRIESSSERGREFVATREAHRGNF